MSICRTWQNVRFPPSPLRPRSQVFWVFFLGEQILKGGEKGEQIIRVCIYAYMHAFTHICRRRSFGLGGRGLAEFEQSTHRTMKRQRQTPVSNFKVFGKPHFRAFQLLLVALIELGVSKRVGKRRSSKFPNQNSDFPFCF